MAQVACHCCGLIQRPLDGQVCWCARCRTRLHSPDSAPSDNTPAAALAVMALAFYPLAVLAPFLRIERLGFASESSLLGGIRTMFQEGHVLVGGVVLVFSVLLPLGKLVTLLALSTSARWWREEHRAVTYRVVEQLGRWGMLDVLLVAVLVAFVKLGDLVAFDVGPGLFLFAGFVMLNLLAGMAFNPHLLWDETMSQESTNGLSPSTPVASDRTPGRRVWWAFAVLGVIAAAMTALFLWPEPGPRVNVSFADGRGLRPGDVVRYRGIDVGEVTTLTLDAGAGRVDVAIELTPSAESLARSGTRWWIVRPDVSLGGVNGLETLLGNKYVTLQPGDGEPATRFTGLEAPPLIDRAEPGGLTVVVQSDSGPRLREGAGVYHRGVRVGGVETVKLASDASAVEYTVYIRPAFRRLVTSETKFWNTSGATLALGVDGVALRVDSMEELLTGGMAIAVPRAGKPVSEGSRFPLFDEPKDEWTEWRPMLAANGPSAGPIPNVVSFERLWKPGGWWNTLASERMERGVVVDVGDAFVGPRALLEPGGEFNTEAIIGGALVPAAWPLENVDPARPFGPRWPVRILDVPEDVRVVGHAGVTNVSAAQWIHDDRGYRFPSRLGFETGSVVLGADGVVIAVVESHRLIPVGTSLVAVPKSASSK